MDAFAIHEGAAAAYSLIDATNEFIAQTAPWTLAKQPADANRLMQVLFDASESIRLCAVMLKPFMPESSAEILRRVGAGPTHGTLNMDGRWRTSGERVLSQGGPLWPRKESGGRERTVESGSPRGPSVPTSQPSGVPAGPPGGPGERLTIDDFMKVELRVAKALAAERVPKSSRLLKLLVDVGTEQRTIVAGIAEACRRMRLSVEALP